MPELDDDELFGGDDDNNEDERDGDESRGGEDDDDSEPEDLEAQFDNDEEEDGERRKEEKRDGGGSGSGKPQQQQQLGGKTVTLSRKEYDELQRKAREIETENAYWKGRAEATNSGKRGREADEGDEDEDDAPARSSKFSKAAKPEDDDPEEFLKDVNKRGLAAIRARGFVSREEVEELVREQAAKIAAKEAMQQVQRATEALHTDAELIAQYPDLRKADSEFSQRVAREVQAMVKADRQLGKSSAVIAAAARAVSAEMKLEERSKKAETDSRERRIAKQAPGGSSRRGERDSDGDDYLTPLQRQVLGPAMKAFRISEREFRDEKARLKGRGY